MELFLTSIIAFASTNIDDIFILTLFFGDRRYKTNDIFFGQYLGIMVLVSISVTGSLIGNFIDSEYIGLLGLFPIYLGVKQFINLIRNRFEETHPEQNEKKFRSGILTVAMVTVANGGDNIGTYIPLFAALTRQDKFIMISIFMAMVSIWVMAAKYLRNHPVLKETVSKYGHIITPVVLFLLGLYIFSENGSFNLLRFK